MKTMNLSLLKQCVIVIMLLLLINFSGLFSVPGSDAADTTTFKIGYTGSIYLDVTNADIMAAINVLVKKIVMKHFGKGEAIIYDSLRTMAADLKSGKIMSVALPPDEFMGLRKYVPVDPILVTSPYNGFDTELLILVRKDSGIRSFRDLRGRSLVMPKKNPRCLSMTVAWLENLLMKEGGGRIPSYFSTVKETRTTAAAIMPVFFRQADACIVSRQVYDLSVELNPQIAREFRVLARKERLAQGILGVYRNVSEDDREKIRDAFMDLHQTTEGKQLLMLFQVRKVIPFFPGYLTATEMLYDEHSRLVARNR